jgi:NAD dependent epimerase/dehydratase family enzyme
MPALITGGLGVIGTRLTEVLRAHSRDVNLAHGSRGREETSVSRQRHATSGASRVPDRNPGNTTVHPGTSPHDAAESTG